MDLLNNALAGLSLGNLDQISCDKGRICALRPEL
jgi:hypothetical protein